MLAFQVIGIVLLVLFFGALVTSAGHRIARH